MATCISGDGPDAFPQIRVSYANPSAIAKVTRRLQAVPRGDEASLQDMPTGDVLESDPVPSFAPTPMATGPAAVPMKSGCGTGPRRSPAVTAREDHDGDGHLDLGVALGMFLNGSYAQIIDCGSTSNRVGAVSGGVLGHAGAILLQVN